MCKHLGPVRVRHSKYSLLFLSDTIIGALALQFLIASKNLLNYGFLCKSYIVDNAITASVIHDGSAQS